MISHIPFDVKAYFVISAWRVDQMVDQLGGWSLKSFGQGYVKGYDLSILRKWLFKI